MTYQRRQTGIAVPAAVIGFLLGTLLGVVTFAVAGFLWHAGARGAAATASDYAVFTGLVCLAAGVAFSRPARRRRARVPINRALPPQWWPQESDSVPLIAACVSAPLIIGAGMALLLFR
jgi:hypothetical protein